MIGTVGIAALSETRFAEEWLLKEIGAGYTFFLSGRKKEERREAGIGFTIKSHLVSKLSGLPKGINDRLMTLRLPLSGKRHVTIVSAYAPTMTNPDEVKDKSYDDLDSVISATPRTDKLILLRDFNARVGTDHQTWEGVIGTEGVGKCNSNGLLLLKKCAEHELLITYTVFRLLTRNKTSWMHPLIQTLASHLLCHSTKEGQTGCQSDRVCVVQTAGQITGLLSANSTCAFSLHVKHKARKCQRDWMSPS